MKYCAIDLETTCINPKCPESILMFSFIAEDSSQNKILDLKELPHYSGFLNHKKISGEAYALQMNAWILRILAKKEKGQYPIIEPDDFEAQCHQFLDRNFPKNRKIVAAGKNVAGFDLLFLPKSVQERFAARSIDPGSMFLNWNDLYPPSLDEIKKRIGRSGEVAHDAREDLFDLIAGLRTTYPE